MRAGALQRFVTLRPEQDHSALEWNHSVSLRGLELLPVVLR